MNFSPLVSIICLCHNHKQFVEEAIRSVLAQTYPHIELILVDDGSNDGSKEVISSLSRSKIHFIDLSTPIGNCKAFNMGFKASKGDYIIDLAADDILLPPRISRGLETFKSKNIGVEFCNVMNIDAKGVKIGIHFKEDEVVPEGDLYIDLIKRYFISSPSVMIRREVLENINGYDESLRYEDFDFWIRSSRNYEYGFTNEILVAKRILPGSLSKKQFRFRSSHQISTLKVCQKIKELNLSKEEDLALKKRCWYEIRKCLRQGNIELIPDFLKMTGSYDFN